MGWNDWVMRLRAFLWRRRAESELDEELRFRLAMEAEKNRTRASQGSWNLWQPRLLRMTTRLAPSSR
jgi:hypothetical protein